MPPHPILTEAIERLLAGEDLGRDGATAALDVIMAGQAEDVQIAAFLVGLRAKGETAAELAGLAAAVRSRSQAVTVAVVGHLDTCGTGGGRPSFNISTTAAFVAAGAGVPVAKHGNRSVTSRCGSADVLEALGASIDLDPEGVARCIEETGVGFMFAPLHHPAFRHVGPVRRALGVRTVFNLLGPLANPAGALHQLIGVYDRAYLQRMAGALAELGSQRALVVSSRDGMDELSTRAISDVVELAGGELRPGEVDPASLGLEPGDLDGLAGGGPEENAAVLRAVLRGDGGGAADVVILNAAAALWVAGAAASIAEALPLAEASVRDGSAQERMEAFVATTARLGRAVA